jgi:cell wall-associated NlpC family hydrolase
MDRLRIALAFLPLLTVPACAEKAVVVVPVADLRSDQSLPEPGKSDDKQQTQLLSGEMVEVVKSSGDWVYINAIEQPEFTTHQKWEGYPGWVKRDALKFGEPRTPQQNYPDSLRPTVTRHGRDGILITASQLIGTPYVWGGLSLIDKTDKIPLSGIDCSGLVHLAYRVFGKVVPRDSMDQFLKADKIKRAELKPADLIFSAKAENPEKITHVALYAGDGQLIEAPQTGMVVRKISFKEKFGADLASVESGQKVGDRYIYFGRFLHD